MYTVIGTDPDLSFVTRYLFVKYLSTKLASFFSNVPPYHSPI